MSVAVKQFKRNNMHELNVEGNCFTGFTNHPT